MHRLINIIILYLLSYSALGQNDSLSILKKYNNHLKKAIEYSEVSLYTESANEYNQAIKIAQEQGWEDKYIDANISLAELMRKTRNFEKGFEIIFDIKNTEKYPILHVRKLGRLAALYHESSSPEKAYFLDSAKLYVQKALFLAEKMNFEKEKASLYNEYGFFVYRYEGEKKEGLSYYLQSADLYAQLKDTNNYVNTMIHVLEYYNDTKNFKKSDSLITELYRLTKDKKWYTTKIDLYSNIAGKYKEQGDSLSFYKWRFKGEHLTVQYLQVAYSTQMNAFKVIHENERFKNEAHRAELITQQKEKELNVQTQRSKELLVYLIILSIMIVGFVFLLVRERKLKKAVNIANEKYQMLMIESNHRIKNNLQMIISMLQYTGKGLDKKSSETLEKISDKIHTISALHKHLCMESHDERVGVEPFFIEIIKLYSKIASNFIEVKTQFSDVAIKSERIVYFGLMFNEMLSNTMLHNKKEKKIVYVSITSKRNSFEFCYFDNSPHPEHTKNGMGTILIQQLINRVGGKNFIFDRKTGKYTFEFDE